jgi:hypothetical protein
MAPRTKLVVPVACIAVFGGSLWLGSNARDGEPAGSVAPVGGTTAAVEAPDPPDTTLGGAVRLPDLRKPEPTPSPPPPARAPAPAPAAPRTLVSARTAPAPDPAPAPVSAPAPAPAPSSPAPAPNPQPAPATATDGGEAFFDGG